LGQEDLLQKIQEGMTVMENLRKDFNEDRNDKVINHAYDTKQFQRIVNCQLQNEFSAKNKHDQEIKEIEQSKYEIKVGQIKLMENTVELHYKIDEVEIC
jgi:hypothetical protein